jgi:hypothetical protein
LLPFRARGTKRLRPMFQVATVILFLTLPANLKLYRVHSYSADLLFHNPQPSAMNIAIHLGEKSVKDIAHTKVLLFGPIASTYDCNLMKIIQSSFRENSVHFSR